MRLEGEGRGEVLRDEGPGEEAGGMLNDRDGAGTAFFCEVGASGAAAFSLAAASSFGTSEPSFALGALAGEIDLDSGDRLGKGFDNLAPPEVLACTRGAVSFSLITTGCSRSCVAFAAFATGFGDFSSVVVRFAAFALPDLSVLTDRLRFTGALACAKGSE